MTHGKHYGRILLWLIPAIAAFVNAQVLKMRDRPSQEFVEPLTRITRSVFHSQTQGAMEVFGYQAGRDFVVQGPANLHVAIRTGFLEPAPPFGVQVVKDYAVYARIEPTTHLPVIRLGDGYHQYSVFVYGEPGGSRMLSDKTHLSARVVYPGTTTAQQQLCVLGLVFLTIGCIQLVRMRRTGI